MNTSKPFSCISYNSEEFLKATLEELYNSRKIDFYYYIKHEAEERDLKVHYHVYMIPNGRINSRDISDMFIEPVENNPLPRRSLDFQCSSESDAILYFLHDREYLRTKHEERKFHYNIDKVITNDKLMLHEIYQRALYSSQFAYDRQLRDKLTVNGDYLGNAKAMLKNGGIRIADTCHIASYIALMTDEGNKTDS